MAQFPPQKKIEYNIILPQFYQLLCVIVQH